MTPSITSTPPPTRWRPWRSSCSGCAAVNCLCGRCATQTSSRRAGRPGRPARDQTGRGRLHHPPRQHPQRQPRRPGIQAPPQGRIQTDRVPLRRRAHLRRPVPVMAVGRGHRQHLDGGGAVQELRFACSPDQAKMLAAHRRGESDLIRRDGKWFLLATCDVPEPEVQEPADWVGVDRGIVNLATTSDGDNHQGRRLSRYRRWQARKRAELQAKRTRSAARRLKKRARREARHARHVNHKIAKQVVAVAARTGRGIALEELRGSADGSRFLATSGHACPVGPSTSWARSSPTRPPSGVPFIEVDPAYTSQLPALRPHRAGQPARSGPFLLSSVRPRWARRPRRRGQRATAHARRGYSSTCPNPPPHSVRAGGCDP